MCVNYKLCVKLHKGSFAFNMEKFPSLQNFYTHTVTDVTDNYQVCFQNRSNTLLCNLGTLSERLEKIRGTKKNSKLDSVELSSIEQ